MRNKKRSLLFGRPRKTRRNSRWIRGRRETNLPFLETVLKYNHHLESQEWMM
jgi:hypothetical protein